MVLAANTQLQMTEKEVSPGPFLRLQRGQEPGRLTKEELAQRRAELLPEVQIGV